MPIELVLLVNKQGQTRLAQYLHFIPLEERAALESEVVRKCLRRKDTDCSVVEHLGYKLVYRRYASLFVIVGIGAGAPPYRGADSVGQVRDDLCVENELAVLEFIHLIVETLDEYFGNVCELDVMFNSEKAHFILEEMLANGSIAETNPNHVLQPVALTEKETPPVLF